jgi:hypothetical protein
MLAVSPLFAGGKRGEMKRSISFRHPALAHSSFTIPN